MKTQRNMAQMKEQIKTPEKDLNKMEISILSDAEFKTRFKDVQGTQCGPQQHKTDPFRNKDTLIEIKNNLQGK